MHGDAGKSQSSKDSQSHAKYCYALEPAIS
jgi:hypothetical protein